MKRLRFFPVMVILLVALFPLALYAETSHDGHGGGAAPSSQKQDAGPSTGQNMVNPSGSEHNMLDMQGSGQAGQTGTPSAAVESPSGQNHDGHGSGTAAMKAPSHDQHGSVAATGKVSSTNGHDQHGTAVSEKSSAGEHQSGGHGGESAPNVLQPVKNSLVAGFAIFNGIIIIAAIMMKKKLGQGV